MLSRSTIPAAHCLRKFPSPQILPPHDCYLGLSAQGSVFVASRPIHMINSMPYFAIVPMWTFFMLLALIFSSVRPFAFSCALPDFLSNLRTDSLGHPPILHLGDRPVARLRWAFRLADVWSCIAVPELPLRFCNWCWRVFLGRFANRKLGTAEKSLNKTSQMVRMDPVSDSCTQSVTSSSYLFSPQDLSSSKTESRRTTAAEIENAFSRDISRLFFRHQPSGTAIGFVQALCSFEP